MEIKTITEKEAKALLDSGWIQIYVLFEIIGRPKEFVEQRMEESLKEFIKKDMKIISFEQKEAIEAGEDEHGKYFSVVAEAELMIDGIDKVLDIALNYTPSHMEIIKPSKITLKEAQLTNFFGQLLEKLHYINNVVIAQSREIDKQKKSLKLLAKNAVVLALMSGPKSLDELARLTGINKVEMSGLLKEMQNESLIKPIQGKFVIAK